MTVLEALLAFDAEVLEAVESVRWAPLSLLFVVLSAWWVKGLVFAGAAAAVDLRARRQPFATAGVLVAFMVALGVTRLVKEAVDRIRPAAAEAHLTPLIATPGNPSFPSGHASEAFAAATALALLCPRLRWPALALAALVAFSRVYLGVHYPLDVLVGALLGVAVGVAVGLVARRLRIAYERGARRSRVSRPRASTSQAAP